MKKAIWLGLWAVCLCGAVIGGIAVARPKRPQRLPAAARHGEEREEEKLAGTTNLVGQLDELREGIDRKEGEIRRLREELAALRSRLRPGLTPEVEKELRERLESRKRDEAPKPEDERSNILWRKILQRKDKALREAGLTELLALLQSTKPEDREMGFGVLRTLEGVPFEKERFKPYVLAALSDERASIRSEAADCVRAVCAPEEVLDAAVRMIRDSDLGIRFWAAQELNGSSDPQHKEMAVAAFRSLLEEGDQSLKWGVLERLYDSADAMDDMIVKLMGEEGLQGAMYSCFRARKTITAPIVQRLAEMYEEGKPNETIFWFLDMIHLGSPDDVERQQSQPCLSDDARPIVADLCLKIVRDAPGNGARRHALDALRKLGDARVIPELDEISRSPNAEGIEQELAGTIAHLQGKPKTEDDQMFGPGGPLFSP
jgi:hypothetical protein